MWEFWYQLVVEKSNIKLRDRNGRTGVNTWSNNATFVTVIR